MQRYKVVLALTGLSLFALQSRATEACKIDTVGFSTQFRAAADPNPVAAMNADLGDYGLIFEDSSVYACSDRAAAALLAKVQNTLAVPSHLDGRNRPFGPYQGWIEGAQVALIFAAALQIGGQGDLTTVLDNALIRVRDYYSSNPTFIGLDESCGFAFGRWINGNTCADDYAVGADAYAWMAAYEFKRRGLTALTQTFIDYARGTIYQTLFGEDSLCIFNPSLLDGGSAAGRGPCNGTLAHLQAETAEIVSLNHGFQNMGYGVGLMPLISGALIGLEEANAPTFLSDPLKIVAMAILEEGQKKSTSDGDVFKTNCFRFSQQSGMVVWSNDANCWDRIEAPFRPKMYPVNYFYSRYSIGTPKTTVVDLGIPQAAYQFDAPFDASLFRDDPTVLFNPARRVLFNNFGYSWHFSRPRLAVFPLNDYLPIGYMDGIDASGITSGWACDRDDPSSSIQVHFYADGFGTFLGATVASLPSEPAVTSACGGGTAHRFAFALPPSSRGRLIYAYGIDLTRGFANLPGLCPQSPACTW